MELAHQVGPGCPLLGPVWASGSPPPFIFLEPGGKASALPLGSPGRQRHVDAFPRKSVLQWYGRYDPLGLIAMPLRMRVYGSFVDISALA